MQEERLRALGQLVHVLCTNPNRGFQRPLDDGANGGEGRAEKYVGEALPARLRPPAYLVEGGQEAAEEALGLLVCHVHLPVGCDERPADASDLVLGAHRTSQEGAARRPPSGIVQRLHARQPPSLEQLQRRTAAGRDVSELGGEAEALERSGSVSSPCDSRRV